MCKNFDSPHPLTPSPKLGRRGTRIFLPSLKYRPAVYRLHSVSRYFYLQLNLGKTGSNELCSVAILFNL
jgi:hypothetical protein